MTDHILYDVRDDRLFAGNEVGLYFLTFAVLWTALWIVIHRYVRGMPEERRKNWRTGAVIGALFIVIGGLIIAERTWPGYWNQRQCRLWLEAGDYETVTGTVADLRRDAGKYAPRQFRVGEVEFTYRSFDSQDGGFQGNFTGRGYQDRQIREGLPVRVAHRNGRILRMELLSRAPR